MEVQGPGASWTQDRPVLVSGYPAPPGRLSWVVPSLLTDFHWLPPLGTAVPKLQAHLPESCFVHAAAEETGSGGYVLFKWAHFKKLTFQGTFISSLPKTGKAA